LRRIAAKAQAALASDAQMNFLCAFAEKSCAAPTEKPCNNQSLTTLPNPMKRLISIAILASEVLSASAFSQVRVPDFDAVTTLAQNALVGIGTQTPVDGFEIRLLVNGQCAYGRAFGDWMLGQTAKIDSTTKTVSGAVIASLLDSSTLPFTLDSKLSQFLPSFNTTEKRDITLRQAFSHSSGLASDSAAVNFPNITLQQCAALIGNNTPVENGPPGTKFSYGGASMQAAGAAAEIAGGDTFVNLLQHRLLDPLGMNDTRFYTASLTNPRVAGGIESTASDMGKLMEMLRRGGMYNGRQVLSSASVQAMLTRQTAMDIEIVNTPLDGVADYGIGIWLDERDANGNLLSAVAAGARGFTSWVDLTTPITGVLSTDLTSGQNVRALDRALRLAARDAVNMPALAGDTDRDEDVDFDDLLTLAQNYNASGRLFAQGDSTGDGLVNFDDLLLVAQNYGVGANVAADFAGDWALAQSMLPEPASLWCGITILGTGRKRRS
jgi:CubicO group peptidase (beta-lactamase class C family)